MKKYLNSALVALVGIVMCAAVTFAQVTGGAVTGSVVDATGAVIPNVNVRLADKLRGQVLTATTTDAGSYLFPNVPVGDYTITIEQTGFGTITRDLNVSLNQTTTIDATLQPGGGTNTVDIVGGGEAVVQTDTSQLGKSFDMRKVQDLPINGNPNNLAVLAPNVLPSATGTANNNPVVGGVRNRGNSFNIDGVDNNDPGVTGPSTFVIQDAVEEFTLLQNNFNAEFGAGAGGQFNTITRSGTNEYHGNVFAYIDSQRFNARTTAQDGLEKDFNKQARYGGTFGGPLPFFNFGEGGPVFHSGKNKLFFFGAYERIFQTGAGAAGTFFAPTAAGLNQIAALPGVSPFVINIFRNNVALAPTANAQATADFGTVLGVSGIPFGEVTLPIPNSAVQNSYQINIDHLPNEKNQFRYRYSLLKASSEGAGNGGLGFNNLAINDRHLFSLNWISTISSSIINDLRLSYRRAVDDSPLKDPSLTDFPNLTIESLNLAIGPNDVLPQGGYDNNYQVYDSLTVISGQHTMKFGADYRRALTGSIFLPRSRGDYGYSTFDRLLQDLKPDLLNLRGTGQETFVANDHRFYAFGQDDWKVRTNLTLNLGLRYEYQGLARDAATQDRNAVSNLPGVIEFGVPKTDKNNFAPRLGFAYAPKSDNWIGRFLFGSTQGDSSIRGNYARAFFTNFSNLTLLNLPPQLQGTLNDEGSATNFLASGGAAGVFVPVSGQAASRAATASFIEDQIVPYTDSFTLSYQRQIGRSTGLELRYLSTRGKLLPVQVQNNAALVPDAALIVPTLLAAPTAAQLTGLPTIATIRANNGLAATGNGVRPLAQFGFTNVVSSFPNIGKSWYDGVSASLTRRFTRNVGFTAAYTFSKTLDNSTNELNTSALNPRRPESAGNRFGSGLNIDNEKGLSTLDIPHRFVTSFNIDIPFFNNSENGFLKAVLGGFQINGVFQAQSGQPITVRSGRDSNLNGDAAGDRAIFNPNGDPNISSGIYAVNSAGVRIVNANGTDNLNSPTTVAYVAIDPNAGFISTGFLARSTAPRNSFRTRGFNNTDIVVLKNTRFGRDGRFNFQIGAEIFDLFNQRQQTIAGVGAQTAAFGIAGNVNFNNYDIGTFAGRTVTLRGKFFF